MSLLATIVPSATPSATAFLMVDVLSLSILAFHFPRSNLPLVVTSFGPPVITRTRRTRFCLAAPMRWTREVGRKALSRLRVKGPGPHFSVVVLAHRS
jgi:hypothetical protein